MEPTIGQLSVVHHSKDITWNIPNFRDMPEELNYAVDSPPFVCGDATWRLRVYPNGRSLQGQGCMALILAREEARGSTVHRVQYTLGILNRDGEVYEDFSANHTFDEGNLEKGALRFVDRSAAQSHAVTADGHVSAFCRMRIEGGEVGAVARFRVQVAPAPSPSPDSDEPTGVARLQRDFLRLLLSGIHSDVVLNVRGTEFRAHRAILRARSPVFSALLAGDPTQGKGTALVTVDDCDSDTFPDFLQYLYAGRAAGGVTSASAASLYATADAYDMSDLREECVQCMTRTLSVETFCDVMELALRCDERRLRDAATRFFSRNATRVLVTDRWLAFLAKNCGPANDLFIAAISRMQH